MGDVSFAEQLEIADACERLVLDYCHCGDFRVVERRAAQFAEDAVFESRGATYVGRQVIYDFLTGRDPSYRSMHSVSNITIDVASHGDAKGVSYVTTVIAKTPASGDGPAVPYMIVRGAYLDTFRKGPDGWKIAKRTSRELIPTEML